MPSKLKAGQLVEVQASSEALSVPSEWRKPGADAVLQVGGQRGQLTEFDEETGTWTVATFSADMVSAKEDLLRPLATDDVKDFDLALGPASSSVVMGQELTDGLARKGHVLCKLFIAPEDLSGMVTTADRAVEEGAFSRLATELEPGYLGRDGTGKTLSVDMEADDTAEYVKDSPIKIVEDAISTVGLLLRPHCEVEFGFDIYSRSNSILALPFDGDEDAFPSPDLENEDAASFLSMMWRAKLQVVVNAGPATAQMTMLPKLDGDAETTLTVQPGMMAIFATDRYRFSYEPEGKALMIASWFLDQPKDYVISDVQGDLSYLSSASSGPSEPNVKKIPVTSLAERYAFGVDEPWKLWTAYSKAGWDTGIKHPFARWDIDIYYSPDADQTSGLSYTCHGGFSDGIELFDCRFFDISPAEAKGMDPTQRQVLEVSYMALSGAGWSKKQLQMKPANIAVFVGLDKNEWNSIPKDIAGGFGASSSANAITSNRFNYCMNLKGASMTIDTACSASLVCTHTGKLYLMHNEYDACEAVVICGVNLSISPFTYVGGCGAGMHSHIGRCFTYNFSADGYMRGEATAAVSIKLKNFEPDNGDYALMAGSQVNQDGRSASLTAPNGPSQERCNRAVIKEVKIKPREIDTTECHGTGTSLGDPIEIGAYRKVMAEDPRSEPVTITSSKSNLGHCEGSAGVSGLTKCVLLCMYNEGTPNVHLNALNPHLDMDGFPGIITTEGCLFKAENSYNGVLSFGFGGTNACALIWGGNVMTSRAIKTKDVHGSVMDKILHAPAQEVTITGDDWEEWEMGGPERDSKPGDQWDIEIDEDGVVEYTKKEKEPPQLGDTYFLTGSFNEWTYDVLDPDEALPGLYSAIIELGDAGSEEFQICADQEPSQTFYPDVPQCSLKSAPVKGPSAASRQQVWVIKGQPGDSYRVEFYVSEAATFTVSWIKQT